MAKRELKPCGTEAAYRRHLAHGEEPCAKCRNATREYTALRKARKDEQQMRAAQEKAAELPELEREQILRESLLILRAQLQIAPPQAAASIAKGIRDTLDALDGKDVKVKKPVLTAVGEGGGSIAEIARARQQRKNRVANA